MAANQPVRLRLTLVIEYDANPSSYLGASTPAEMAAIDHDSALSDIGAFIDIFLEGSEPDVFSIEPVSDE